MKAFFVSALLSAAVLLAQECPEVPPMECAEGDQVCPTGADDNGCAYPDVCMPAGADCPVVCAPTPACRRESPAQWSAPAPPPWSVLRGTRPAPWEPTPTDAPSLTCVCPLVRLVLLSKCTFTNIVK